MLRLINSFLIVFITSIVIYAQNYNSINYGALSETLDTTLKCSFSFDNVSVNDLNVTDESGNNFVAVLKNGAVFKEIEDLGRVLSLGATNGYLDLGKEIGSKVISSLHDFTISTYIYIANDANITLTGNCVFNFDNSDSLATYPKGCMYFSARASRYAICSEARLSERGLQSGLAMGKGAWKHIAITYAGTTIKLFFDGILKYSYASLMLAPNILGSTAYNYLGKSAYAADAYLAKTMIDDFRVYNRALPDSVISQLASSLTDYNVAMAKLPLRDALNSIPFYDGQEFCTDFMIPKIINSYFIKWSSSDSSALSPTGKLGRPNVGSPAKNVIFTATIISDTLKVSKQFNLVVLPLFADSIAVKWDADHLKLDPGIKCLYRDITLPVSGSQGSVITWESDHPEILAPDGKIVSKPLSGNIKVTLTATLTHGTKSLIVPFEVIVAKKDPCSAYLFVYFTSETEAIRFALSADGFNYKALNNNNPVLNSAIISSTGGVRDPHIIRSADSLTYYMVATDLKTVSVGGYDNQAIILMKSNDLISWQSTVVNIATTYSQFADTKCAWAPQTIYDKKAGKYMVYWSIKIGSTGKHKIYYAYANTDFTALETEPKLLFERSNGEGLIDADIIEKDSVFHMIYKNETGSYGITKAIATILTGPYIETNITGSGFGFEGPCVFKLIDSDNYILISDNFATYPFAQSTDLVNFTNVSNLTSFNFAPRHGTVMTITKVEKDRLEKKWGVVTQTDNITKTSGIVVSTHIYNINGTIAGTNPLNLKNGLYIRKRIFNDGKVLVDKIFVKN
jgi:hypothetical protein